MSNHVRLSSWNTNPADVWQAAKEKAAGCLDEEDPKLTVLERAFWERLRELAT
jgi:hypothetical protein